MATAVSAIEAEVKELQSHFGEGCHVIDNIGSFVHVASVLLKKWDVTLKFQITANYPSTPADVVISCSSSSSESMAMTSYLDQFLKKESKKSLMECVKCAEKWLEEHGVVAPEKTPHHAYGSGSEEDSSEEEEEETGEAAGDTVPSSPVVNGSQKLLTRKLRKKPKPNYFVCVRITDPDIIKGIQDVQAAIAKANPSYSKCFVDIAALHMTICTLVLETENQVSGAYDVLERAKFELSKIAKRDIAIRVVGVHNIFDRVVMARIEPTRALAEFVGAVRIHLHYFMSDFYEFQPHVTILKLTRENQREVGSSRVPRQLYEEFVDKEFGEEIVSSIDLCAMSHYTSRPAGEFYATPLHLDLV